MARAVSSAGGRDSLRAGRLDRPLVAVVLLLAALGLYNLASAGQPKGLDLHESQGIHFAIGLALMAIVASVHYRNLEALALPIYLVSVALLFATEVGGKTVNGSQRWLPIGPVAVQTADLAKLGVILIMARTFHLGRDQGGLTLREVLRPLNVSRPLLLVAAVLAITLTGDAVKPATVKRMVGRHSRAVASLTAKRPVVSIGRGRDVDVKLPYEGVAERHAELVRLEDGHYLVRDLGSEAGTFVNDDRVDRERRVHDKNVIRLGPSTRTELTVSAQLERFRPLLPWTALLGAGWLFAAIFLQMRRAVWTSRDAVAPVDYVLIPAVLVLLQPDLGTALIISLISLTMMMFVGFRPLSLVLLVASGIAGVALSWSLVLKPYQKDRVLTFLNPTTDLAGAGYHQHQSMIAIGSGGLWGQGHGQGTQTQLSFLPEQQTDFIFSVWAEEHGFVGCAIVVLLFAVLIVLSLRVVAQARDRFGALLAMGVTAMLFWHVAINIFMVLRLAPVVGVPLPLWSNGGTFVITVCIGIGILLGVGMRRFVF